MAILVTTDGSEASRTVLPHADALARALGQPLLLLRVLDRRIDLSDEVATTVAEATGRVSARWQEEMDAVLHAANIAGESIVALRERSKPIEQAILRVAGERGATALAMHSQGTGAVRHVLLGSITMGIVGEAAVPVLVTGGEPEAPAPETPYRIAVTSDGSRAAEAAVTAIATLLDGIADIPVTLISIAVPHGKGGLQTVEDCRAHLEELRSLLPAGIEVELRPGERGGDESVEDAINRIATESRAHALAISTHGHSARRHLFAGSVAMGALRTSTMPLLLVRAGD